jgi:cytochrome c oxidase cbb3-type subunit 3
MTLNLRAFIVTLLASVSLVSVAAAAAPKHDCQAAKDLFNNRCVMCHGPDGKGYAAIGTPNFTDPKFQASQTDAQLIDAVTNGKRGETGQMPAFKGQLTNAQISDLVHCVVRGFAPGGAKKGSAKHSNHTSHK